MTNESPTTEMENKKPTLVVLTSGERLEFPEERIEGVMTDAGLIPWDEVEGFFVWHVASGRYLFIPQ